MHFAHRMQRHHVIIGLNGQPLAAAENNVNESYKQSASTAFYSMDYVLAVITFYKKNSMDFYCRLYIGRLWQEYNTSFHLGQSSLFVAYSAYGRSVFLKMLILAVRIVT